MSQQGMEGNGNAFVESCLICEHVFASQQELCEHMRIEHEITITESDQNGQNAVSSRIRPQPSETASNTVRSDIGQTESTVRPDYPVSTPSRSLVETLRNIADSDRRSPNTARSNGGRPLNSVDGKSVRGHSQTGSDNGALSAHTLTMDIAIQTLRQNQTQGTGNLDEANDEGHDRIREGVQRRVDNAIRNRLRQNPEQNTRNALEDNDEGLIRKPAQILMDKADEKVSQNQSQGTRTSKEVNDEVHLPMREIVQRYVDNVNRKLKQIMVQSSSSTSTSSSTPRGVSSGASEVSPGTSSTSLIPGEVTTPASGGAHAQLSDSATSDADEPDSGDLLETETCLQESSSMCFSCVACSSTFDNYLDLNVHISEAHSADPTEELSQFCSMADNMIKDTELMNEERPTLWDVKSVTYRLSPILELEESNMSLLSQSLPSEPSSFHDLLGNGDMPRNSFHSENYGSVDNDHASHPPSAKRRRRDSADSGISIGPLSSGGQQTSSSSATPRESLSPVSFHEDVLSSGDASSTDHATGLVISNVRSLFHGQNEQTESNECGRTSPAEMHRKEFEVDPSLAVDMLRYYTALTDGLQLQELINLSIFMRRPTVVMKDLYFRIKELFPSKNSLETVNCCHICGVFGLYPKSARDHLFSREHMQRAYHAIKRFRQQKTLPEGSSADGGSSPCSTQYAVPSSNPSGFNRMTTSLAAHSRLGSDQANGLVGQGVDQRVGCGMNPVLVETQVPARTNNSIMAPGFSNQTHFANQNTAGVGSVMNHAHSAKGNVPSAIAQYRHAHQAGTSNAIRQDNSILGHLLMASHVQQLPGRPGPSLCPSSAGQPQQPTYPQHQQQQTRITRFFPSHQQQQGQFQTSAVPSGLSSRIPTHPGNRQILGNRQPSMTAGPRQPSASNQTLRPMSGFIDPNSAGSSFTHYNNLRTLMNIRNGFTTV